MNRLKGGISNTYSVRDAAKEAQRSKLHGYKAVGKKAVQVRREQRSRYLNSEAYKAKKRELDHKQNAFEAFMNVDGK